MKVLHTSDWHLGRTTRNVSRAPDHERVLGEIIDIAHRSRPDLILHTGDLFDVVRPPYESMQLGLQALQELAAIAPVVVLCGNHDSPLLFRLFGQILGTGRESLERLRPILEDSRRSESTISRDVPLREHSEAKTHRTSTVSEAASGLGDRAVHGPQRIHFVDRPRLPEGGGILHFESAEGELIKLAPVPFVHANRMIEAFETDPSEWTAAYADRIHRLENVLGRGLQQDYDVSRDVLLFAAHLHVGGARFSTSERPIHVSDVYATCAEHLPPVTYAAFGHIHRPQALPGMSTRGRYAGSPIQLDFGELGEEKSVVLVEAKPGDAPEITTIPLSGGRPLRRFDGTLKELALLAPEIGEELCSFVIRTLRPVTDLADHVRDLVPRGVVLEVIESCAARAAETLARVETSDDSEPDFTDLLRQYLRETGSKSGDPDQVRGLFATLLGAVQAEQIPDLSVLRSLRNPMDPASGSSRASLDLSAFLDAASAPETIETLRESTSDATREPRVNEARERWTDEHEPLADAAGELHAGEAGARRLVVGERTAKESPSPQPRLKAKRPQPRRSAPAAQGSLLP